MAGFTFKKNAVKSVAVGKVFVQDFILSKLEEEGTLEKMVSDSLAKNPTSTGSVKEACKEVILVWQLDKIETALEVLRSQGYDEETIESIRNASIKSLNTSLKSGELDAEKAKEKALKFIVGFFGGEMEEGNE
jgi:hypothetical protein